LVSKALKGLILAVGVIVIAGVAAGSYFGAIRESNVQYCRATQDRINEIAADRAMTREQKDKEIQDILVSAVNELRKRDFKCPEAFLQPEYNRP
jgi:hypothetical protein